MGGLQKKAQEFIKSVRIQDTLMANKWVVCKNKPTIYLKCVKIMEVKDQDAWYNFVNRSL
jgi:hypothetical protein